MLIVNGHLLVTPSIRCWLQHLKDWVGGESQPKAHRAPDVVDHVEHRHLGDAFLHTDNWFKVEKQISEHIASFFETRGKSLWHCCPQALAGFWADGVVAVEKSLWNIFDNLTFRLFCNVRKTALPSIWSPYPFCVANGFATLLSLYWHTFSWSSVNQGGTQLIKCVKISSNFCFVQL